jgi:hypothetical protein
VGAALAPLRPMDVDDEGLLDLDVDALPVHLLVSPSPARRTLT